MSFRCTGCGRAFGRGRALYIPAREEWYHKRCFKSSSVVPVGTEAFQREPTEESLARHATHDVSLRERVRS